MPPIRDSASRRWCFTLNNYTDADVAFIEAPTWVVKYVVAGKELAPTTQTPHLQGFVIFENGQRLSQVRRLFGGRAHWEATRGDSQQASFYCKKDGNFVERGVLPGRQTRGTAIERAIEWCDEFIHANQRAPTRVEISYLYPAGTVIRNFHQTCMDRASVIAPAVLQQGEPRRWQLDLSDELQGEADDRTVVFYVDEAGNSGKSWFQKWFFTNNHEKTQLCGVGRVIDVAYTIDESKSVFLFNVPRGGMEFFQYSVVEQLKDGLIFSSKYESALKQLRKPPHVVVFCNEEPDQTKLSPDRFDIRRDYPE